MTESQLRYQRSKAVSKAWERERELVRRGRGTRDWKLNEQKQLLKTGRVKGYEGHHMKSVHAHPEYAGDSKNIQFLSRRKGNNEHLKAHRGNFRTESDGRYNVKTGNIRPVGEGRPRAMYSRELSQKAVEKRGYTKYAVNSGKTTSQRNYVKKTGRKAESSHAPADRREPVRYGRRARTEKMAGKSNYAVRTAEASRHAGKSCAQRSAAVKQAGGQRR